jgi:hypothetical protein
MATEKLIAGATSAYTSLMTTELNALAAGSAIAGTTTVANGTDLDLYAEFSFTSGATITGSATPYLSLFIYPLNGDGSTYGDNRFASATAAVPPSNYYRGYCGLGIGNLIQKGTFAIPGSSAFQLPLPRGTWKPVLYNGANNALSATSNVLTYRTTNRQIS